MSSISTAALEYNTDGELTIKNRQNESTGNSLKFRTSTSESTDDNYNKLIDIKQNNISRLSIAEVGTGAITIERNPADPEDSAYSLIKIESNGDSKTSSDINKELIVSPDNISLGTRVYAKDNKGNILTGYSKYININSINKQEGRIELQNNKYQLDSNKEFILNGQKEFIKDSYSYMNLGVSDLQLGVVKESSGNSYESYMKLDNSNGITINGLTREFAIKNEDFEIRASKDAPAPSLRFDRLPDTQNPNIQNLMEMTKESVNIPKLRIGDNTNPIITAFPHIKDASNFYLQTKDNDNTCFYIAYKYGSGDDINAYGMKVTFTGSNSTVTGFVGKIDDKGVITEGTQSSG